MFKVTERAAQELYQFLQSEGKTEYALRIVAQEGGCSCCGPSYGLFLEKESAPGDTIIQAGPVKIFLDQMSSALLDEATLDFQDDPQPGFFIDNPKFSSQGNCGCQ
jgi:iron-sulfur cluster assembly accessory protein